MLLARVAPNPSFRNSAASPGPSSICHAIALANSISKSHFHTNAAVSAASSTLSIISANACAAEGRMLLNLLGSVGIVISISLSARTRQTAVGLRWTVPVELPKLCRSSTGLPVHAGGFLLLNCLFAALLAAIVIARESDVASGIVKWFNGQKGYGFIAPDTGGKDVFVHISAVEKAGYDGLPDGAKVTFDVVPNRGKESAENLRLK